VRKTALLVGPTIAVLLGTPLLKPPPAPAPVEIVQPVEVKKTLTKRRPIQLREKKVDRLAPGKAQPKKKPGKATGSPAGQPKPQNSGLDLPWPCWVVKMHAAGKSEAQLRAEGRAAGIKLTLKQEKQAKACLRS
jgi:hypothetical protein